MSSDRVSTLAAVALLLAAGAAAWWFQLREHLAPAPVTLSSLPLELGSFTGIDTPLDAMVEEMLRADHNVQREYRHPLGGIVWLYIGYYGTERGGTPEHTPRACYRAHGWDVIEQADLTVDPETGLRAREYVVELAGQQQLVLYWYRSFRDTGMVTTVALGLDHVLGKLRHGRGDGALVRLSAPLSGGGSDREATRASLLSFARELEPELARVWPSEHPKSPALEQSGGLR
jgi:EpsI family protein